MTFSRVLVRAPNWLGDIVMALPALGAIRRHFPDADLSVAAPASLAPMFSLVPGVSNVVPLAGGRADVARLAAGRFDLGILFPNSFSSALALKRAGVPERWGYRSDLRGPLLTRAVRRPRRRAKELQHHAHHYQELVRALDIEPVPLDVRLEVPAELMARARALLNGRLGAAPDAPLPRLIGLAPGAAYGHAKRWLPERFAELIALAWREERAVSVMVGSAGDRPTSRAIESSLARLRAAATEGDAAGPAPIDLTGATNLPMLMAVAASCAAFVSNDSGAMHLASAVGVPVTAIFGPTNEHATRPLGPHELILHPVWCRPCMLRECPIDHRCMSRITARRALEAVARQLSLRHANDVDTA